MQYILTGYHVTDILTLRDTGSGGGVCRAKSIGTYAHLHILSISFKGLSAISKTIAVLLTVVTILGTVTTATFDQHYPTPPPSRFSNQTRGTYRQSGRMERHFPSASWHGIRRLS